MATAKWIELWSFDHEMYQCYVLCSHHYDLFLKDEQDSPLQLIHALDAQVSDVGVCEYDEDGHCKY